MTESVRSVSCPLCGSWVAAASLETHLRVELSYTAFRCLLCPLQFFSLQEAAAHFEGPLAEHRGAPAAIAKLSDPGLDQRLLDALRAADKRPTLNLPCPQALHCAPACHAARQGLPPPPPVQTAPSQAPALSSKAAAVESPQPRPPSSGDETADAPPMETQGPEEAAPEAEAGKLLVMPLVKAEPGTEPLAEAKPAADGKVACVQCGVRAAKWSLERHALTHAPAPPYNCNSCAFDSKERDSLKKHLKREHEEEMGDGAFTFSLSPQEVKDLVAQCFGETQHLSRPRLRCKPCDKVLDATKVKEHIASAHLKKVIHSCLHCDFASTDFTAGKINAHLQRTHKLRPGPDNAESRAASFLPAIKNMIPKLCHPV